MTVTNRKMFNRGARNKVRQMGGIMASSEPLINEVARFQLGGEAFVPRISSIQDRIGIDQDAPIINLPEQPFTKPLERKRPGQVIGEVGSPLFEYFKENPAEAIALGLTAIPGIGLAVKGTQLSLKAANTIKNLVQRGLFGTKTRTGITLGVGGAGAYAGQDFVNPLLKEGIPQAIKDAPQGIAQTVQAIPSGIASADKAIKEALNIKGPQPKPLTEQEMQEIQKIQRDVQGPFDSKALTTEDLQKIRSDIERGVQGPFDSEAEEIQNILRSAEEIPEDVQKARLEREAQEKKIYEETQALGSEEQPTETVETDEGVYPDAPIRASEASDAVANKKAQEASNNFKNDGALGEVNENVKNTFKTGVGVKGAVKQYVDEFLKNAPKYDGLDSGLAIAKIGFAMAAGESPNAITNIAKALSDGADMFIKDKAQKDAWNRQVELAALQYGVGEVSKDRQEARAVARLRMTPAKFTFGPNGGTYRGTKYGPYETVSILQGDIIDNNLPPGLMEPSMITALKTKGKGFDTLIKDLAKQAVIGEDRGAQDQKDYSEAVSKIILAERGQAVINKVLLLVNDEDRGITGFTPAVQAVRDKYFKTFTTGEASFSNIEKARTYMRQLLQDIVPVSLANVQSANSISNRDIDLLITAFFGDNALEPGLFNFVFQSPGTITQRLQGAAARMASDQRQSFSMMSNIEKRLGSLLQRGTAKITPEGGITGESALGLLEADRKRLEESGITFQGQTIPAGSSVNYYRDKEGMIQFGNPEDTKV